MLEELIKNIKKIIDSEELHNLYFYDYNIEKLYNKLKEYDFLSNDYNQEQIQGVINYFKENKFVDYNESNEEMSDINLFCSFLDKIVIEDVKSYILNLSLSILINNSKTNSFNFDVNNINLSYFLYKLSNKRVKLEVQSNDYNIGEESDNSTIIIEGDNKGSILYNSTNSKLSIKGDNEGNIGDRSNNTNIIIEGDNKGSILYNSTNSKLFIKRDNKIIDEIYKIDDEYFIIEGSNITYIPNYIILELFYNKKKDIKDKELIKKLENEIEEINKGYTLILDEEGLSLML